MKLFQSLGLLGLIVLIYGWIARASAIYFFWEAAWLGWIILLIGLLGMLWQLIPRRRDLGKKNRWTRVAIGAIFLVLFLQVFLPVVMISSGAYAAAVSALSVDASVTSVIGPVQSTSLLPSGSYHSSSDTQSNASEAAMGIIFKGKEKYVIVNAFCSRGDDGEWELVRSRVR